jgi:hypothetical protein
MNEVYPVHPSHAKTLAPADAIYILDIKYEREPCGSSYIK